MEHGTKLGYQGEVRGKCHKYITPLLVVVQHYFLMVMITIAMILNINIVVVENNEDCFEWVDVIICLIKTTEETISK